MQKRAFDIMVSAVVLSASAALGGIILVLVKITSRGPALFGQRRVGLHGRFFTVYKFRTMTVDDGNGGVRLTRDGDMRLTPLGKILRRLKLDEIPQFYNVLRGDMSLVGPRPKLPEYSVASDWQYRPGITGFATLAFRREEEMLRDVPPDELNAFYDTEIKPIKARLDRWYMRRASFISDLILIWKTVTACLAPSPLRRRKTVGRGLVPEAVWTDEQVGMDMSLETESVE